MRCARFKTTNLNAQAHRSSVSCGHIGNESQLTDHILDGPNGKDLRRDIRYDAVHQPAISGTPAS